MEAPPPSQTSSLLLLLFLLLTSPSSTTSQGLRIELTHIDATQNLAPLELLQRAVERTKIRAAGHTVQSAVHAGGVGEYIMELAVGTPPVAYRAVLDTGSDLMWTQCEPCKGCDKQQQAGPILFDPSRSSTFRKVECSSEMCKWLTTRTCISACEYYYSYSYSDDKLARGVLATETITLGSTKQVRFPHIGFGCGYHGHQHAFGYVGLGRGHLSLTSQLGITRFSYCFTSFGSSNKSHLLLGSEAGLDQDADGKVQSVRLFRNPDKPSLYYLSLEAVTVGNTHLRTKQSDAFEDYGYDALIIDSGASITALGYKLYGPVLKAFKFQVKLPVANRSVVAGLDLCFSVPPNRPTLASLKLPTLVFHFDQGARMKFPVSNYMSLHSDASLVCLAICSTFGMESILGNFQQQNMNMIIDLENEKLSYIKARCDQL